MEDPCKIVCFGDSLTAGYAPLFERRLKQEFPDIDCEVVNAGVGGETSRDGLKRLPQLLKERPQVVLIGFGMNDLSKGVTTVELADNLSQVISRFEDAGARVLLLTLNPLRGGPGTNGNVQVAIYNQIIKDVALEKRIRVVEINSLWKKEIKPWHKGLKDDLHPNRKGYEVYLKALLRVVPRRNTILLWQYNGNPCECNYACPYCSYDPRTQKGHYFKGTIEAWQKAFKKAFGNQHLVFYLAHGEPMAGEKFYDVLDMVADEPNWEVRMTSNISLPLDRLVKTQVAREKRLNVNASFHPTMTRIEDFLKQALFLRENGIEVPIIYVMWPPFFKRFQQDFRVFNEHRFLVHMRRFQGLYRGKLYPQAYTEEERLFMARYMDDAMLKYMLSWEPSFGKLTWSGVDFMIIDNEGNIGYCDDFRPDGHCLGNILNGTLRLLPEPGPFPEHGVSDGTVDGVANFLELNYRQLTENNVLSFARQGGVYHTKNGVFYKNLHTDFNDSRIRAIYRFPPRNITDCYHILRCRERTLESRTRQVLHFLLPEKVWRLRSAVCRLPLFARRPIRAAARMMRPTPQRRPFLKNETL
jgi:acyl-CoA thioesterase-1